jgi:hypothetical protein
LREEFRQLGSLEELVTFTQQLELLMGRYGRDVDDWKQKKDACALRLEEEEFLREVEGRSQPTIDADASDEDIESLFSTLSG